MRGRRSSGCPRVSSPTRRLPAGVGLAHQIIAPVWPAPVGIASGPTFAEEIARGLPAALTVAATAPCPGGTTWLTILRGETLRAYASDDIAGVEVGGAVKNVLAIAAGASDGLGSATTRAPRSSRAGWRKPAGSPHGDGRTRETLMGLAGLGDLVLTCTGRPVAQSPRRPGARAGQARCPRSCPNSATWPKALRAATAVRSLAAHHGVEMPICDAVYRVLYEDLPVQLAVEALLEREPRTEQH